MLDMTEYIKADSDQITAADLAEPVVLQISEVRLTEDAKKPIAIFFEGQRFPWLPSKTSRRVLVKIWGSDGHAYVGRWLRLYCDPTVTYAGEEVGGVRISGASHIKQPVTGKLPSGRRKYKSFSVGPLKPPERQAPEIVGWSSEEEDAFLGHLDALNADLMGVERWCESKRWPMPSKMTGEKRTGLLQHLGTQAGRESYERANRRGGTTWTRDEPND